MLTLMMMVSFYLGGPTLFASCLVDRPHLAFRVWQGVIGSVMLATIVGVCL